MKLLAKQLAVYAITPSGFVDAHLLQTRIESAIRGGITAIQFRDKDIGDSRQRMRVLLHVQKAARNGKILFIVNDSVELAIKVSADGVHLGPNDMSVREAKALDDRLLVGASVGSVEAAVRAFQEGADYLGVGAIFDALETKPNASSARGTKIISEIRAELKNIPIVAIGGISAENATACIQAGANGVASVRALLGAESPRKAATQLAKAVQAGLKK